MVKTLCVKASLTKTIKKLNSIVTLLSLQNLWTGLWDSRGACNKSYNWKTNAKLVDLTQVDPWLLMSKKEPLSTMI